MKSRVQPQSGLSHWAFTISSIAGELHGLFQWNLRGALMLMFDLIIIAITIPFFLILSNDAQSGYSILLHIQNEKDVVQ